MMRTYANTAVAGSSLRSEYNDRPLMSERNAVATAMGGATRLSQSLPVAFGRRPPTVHSRTRGRPGPVADR
jgi:hypothetical protein